MTFDSKNESLRKFMVSHIRDDMNTHSNGFMMDYYTLLYKHYPDAIFTMDREGNLIDINDKTEEVIGYKPRDIIGSNFSHFLKKEHLPTIQEYFERALKGEPQNYLCEVLHKNGQIVHLSAQIIPIEWKHEIVGVFGFAKSQTELVQKELELTKVTNSLNLAQQVAKIGSWDYDIETDCLFCSESLKEILGFDNQQKVVINYENLLKMIYFQKDREYFDHHFQRIKHSGGKMDLEYKVKLLDDHMITLRVTAEAKKDKHGRISRIIGIANDITDQVLTKSKLKESEEKFEKIAQNIDVGLWSMDYTLNQIVYVSPAIEQIAGYHPEVFLTGEKTWEELIHPDDMENYRHHLNSLFHGEIVSQQYRIINAHAEVRWLEDKTFPIIGANGELIRLDGIVQDISERKEHEEKINFIANHDYLTKLYNRRMFDQKLEEFISKKDKFVLYYLDIDRFKFVNDTLGHEIGDGLLIAISERLSTLVGNDLVFRLGGDEFAIILTNIQEYDYLALGQEIIREIEKPFQIEGYDINISTSIGGNIFPDDGETLSELKSNADVALYRAKDLGKNNVQFFTKSLNSETYQLFNLENDLRNAIRNDEFSLYYQPKVDTFTGEMAGAEALVGGIIQKGG
ncbi:sensor domain-containing diguanylate cyclase [Bacillus tuaregi]|uniref:sensor domain-containing diguanylate cyclase n=1 Tax=Bacillus tuaregi TaxID=1816695 RepID=UPI0008F849A0|nr:sensor domain-containing diguanylate cyclase [Bacillus tuaregi]